MNWINFLQNLQSIRVFAFAKICVVYIIRHNFHMQQLSTLFAYPYPCPYNPCPFLWFAFSSCFFSTIFFLFFFFVKLHAHIQSNIYLKLMPEAFHYCARKNIYFCSASVVSLFLFSLGISSFFLLFLYFLLFSVCKCAACRFVLAVRLFRWPNSYHQFTIPKFIYFYVFFFFFIYFPWILSNSLHS